jgi:hypothetical protein
MEHLSNNSEQYNNTSLQQSKEISEALVKTFDTYFAVTENIEDCCTTLNVLMFKMRDFYNEEKQNFYDYKKTLAIWEISPSTISDHANAIQTALKKHRKAFDDIHKEMKNNAKFLKRIWLSFVQEDKKEYSKKIYESYKAFKDVFLDIQNIAFAQELLVKKS